MIQQEPSRKRNPIMQSTKEALSKREGFFFIC
jgi:hypothetical protein